MFNIDGSIDIFKAVQSGEVTRGVIPFENSTNGSVIFTLDLLADRQNSYTSLSICDEIYLDVHHYLLGHPSKSKTSALLEDERSRSSTPTQAIPNPLKPRARPTTNLKHIKRIYSHPQAFGQCEVFLDAYLKGVERIDTTSTSKAAEEVKNDHTGTSASISSKIAADVQKLSVLAEGIEDRADNTTRFFVLKKGHDTPVSSNHREQSTAKSKSLVTFTVHHDSPGALADVLDCFKKHQLNLTSINNRPSRIVPFQYIFLLEFEGSKFHDPTGAVKEALECLDNVAQKARWWGSWTDRLKR